MDEPLSPFTSDRSMSEADLKALFVGNKYEKYYREKFERITPKHATSGFNIAAFLLSVIWLFYRKMYAYGLVYLGFIFALSLVMDIFQVSYAIDLSISIALSLFMGIWGNTIYKHHVEKKLKHISETYAGDETQIRQKILERGGTNPVAGWLLFIITVVYLSIGVWLTT